MRIEHGTSGDIDIYVRQSWIGDAVMCAERGRFGIIDEAGSLANELTILGTGVHAGIAADLEAAQFGEAPLSIPSMVIVAQAAIEVEMAMEFKWSGTCNRAQMDAYVPELLEMYHHTLRPLVADKVVAVEWGFDFILDTYQLADGRTVTVHGKGTADLLTSDPHTPLWDWKTSGQPYKPFEKQQQAHQPTMYAAAAAAAGLAAFPMNFNYGVMVRDKKAQVVSVRRTEAHVDWLRSVIRPFVSMALLVGTDQSWPRTDTGYLCSEKWCSWYSDCKGSKISFADNQLPIGVSK